ncbi:MAG: hypothetical protein WDM89_21495 [Rhizomicrobium sp.]
MRASTEVIGLKENSDGKTGIVYVRTDGVDESDAVVVSFNRWVMVRKRDAASKAPDAVVPELPDTVPAYSLVAPARTHFRNATPKETGNAPRWEDYDIGERIDHIDGITIEESEHMMATRLYHNNRPCPFQSVCGSHGPFRQAHRLWRSCHLHCARSVV